MFYNITCFNNPVCVARHYSFHLLLTTNLKERTTVLHSFSLLCELSEKNECLTFSQIYSHPPSRLPTPSSSPFPVRSSAFAISSLHTLYSYTILLSTFSTPPSPYCSFPQAEPPPVTPFPVQFFPLPSPSLPFILSIHTLSFSQPPPLHPHRIVPSSKQNPLQLLPALPSSSLCLLHLLPQPLRPFPTIFTSKPTSFFPLNLQLLFSPS